MLEYIWLIPCLPLIGFAINGLIGKYIGKKLVSLVACGSVGISFLISLLSFSNLIAMPAEERLFEKTLYTWIGSGTFRAELTFQLDPLSAIMILVVTGVGFLIHIYSIGYMHDDEGYARYFTYLNLFTFSMLLLVLGGNFLLMFVGWEAVGLCSYLLIGFWYKKKSATDAGKKAFIVNRVGDFGFILGIMMIFFTFHSVDFQEVFHQAEANFPEGSNTIVWIAMLLFIGATGKSAQIPLYVWLPDAMEGPTPVSALIHAATMVTAGVYMVARCSTFYIIAPEAMLTVAIIGAVTAIFAASIGLVQNDIKKVLAYSTVSQLGYMFLACGVGAFTAAIFHLMTHAFFKALLFLGSGSVIHAMGGEQDIRKMGALRKKMPITFYTFLLATLAIAGFPGFSGFFSKDEILWKTFSSPYGNTALWVVGAVAAGFTSFYMFRLVFLTFCGESRVEPHTEEHLHESPPSMTIPLTILGVLSVIGGYIGIPHILGGHNRIEAFLEPVFKFAAERTNELQAEGSESLELTLMVLSVLIALIGLAVAYYFYLKNKKVPEKLAENFSPIYKLLLNKYYVDEIYDALIVNPIKKGAVFLWEFFDDKIVDGIVNGTAEFFEDGGLSLRKLQSGKVQAYLVSILVGVVLFVGYFLIY
ncbi:MAG: NADH-quinone oxidoreductase subunit L [Candidatus Schekmanbacteria bacterium]|nr:MAG: NADH-quinone oxidoreductase subunit L [Candidatus Schekmanbacteria bacterium]